MGGCVGGLSGCGAEEVVRVVFGRRFGRGKVEVGALAGGMLIGESGPSVWGSRII